MLFHTRQIESLTTYISHGLHAQAIGAMELYVPQASVDFLWSLLDKAGRGLVRSGWMGLGSSAFICIDVCKVSFACPADIQGRARSHTANLSNFSTMCHQRKRKLSCQRRAFPGALRLLVRGAMALSAQACNAVGSADPAAPCSEALLKYLYLPPSAGVRIPMYEATKSKLSGRIRKVNMIKPAEVSMLLALAPHPKLHSHTVPLCCFYVSLTYSKQQTPSLL